MKIKLWVSLVLAFFVFIFITQNVETVNVRFLAWSVEMSLVLLVFIMLGAGVLIGWLLNSYIRYVTKKNKEPVVTAMPDELHPEVQVADKPEESREEDKLDHES